MGFIPSISCIMKGKNLHSILQICSSDGGGGGSIPSVLHNGFKNQSLKSHILVRNKTSSDSAVKYITWDCELIEKIVKKIPLSPKYKTRIQHILKIFFNPKLALRIVNGEEDFAVFRTNPALKKYIGEWNPDIVQCHDLHMWYFGLENLSWLSKEIPTVLTLHDAWLLSGHCAHSLNCDKWVSGCDKCDSLSLYAPILRDAAHRNWVRKSEIYRESVLHIITPSKWLMEKVNRSILQPAILSSKVIPNGVNLTIFKPSNKEDARKKLGLPQNCIILLFAAAGLKSNPWKDFDMLNRTLFLLKERCANQKILCLALGDISDPIDYNDKLRLEFVPFISDPNVVSSYYCAADVYLHPAKADTFPTVIIEAQACGTPVIATNVCGIPEIVIEGKTGYLVPVGDAEMMVKYILELIENNDKREEMSIFAAADAIQRFDQKRMVNEYLEYYQEILSRESC